MSNIEVKEEAIRHRASSSFDIRYSIFAIRHFLFFF